MAPVKELGAFIFLALVSFLARYAGYSPTFSYKFKVQRTPTEFNWAACDLTLDGKKRSSSYSRFFSFLSVNAP